MKKIILSIVVLTAIVSFHGSARADVCGDTSLNNASSSVVYVTCGNGSPENAIGGWGTNNAGVPHVAVGQTVYDDLGLHSTCQWMSGCVDVYHTVWYKGLIDALRAQLGSVSFNNFVNIAGK